MSNLPFLVYSISSLQLQFTSLQFIVQFQHKSNLSTPHILHKYLVLFCTVRAFVV